MGDGHPEGLSFSQLFAEIAKYYSSEIGTNIDHIMDENMNIYSTGSIMEIWELVLGIAIKGRNREKNINTILRMRAQTQEELMRIISKLINKLGENVSVIDNTASQQDKSVVAPSNNNETDIIIELSEENEQLRENIQELNAQIASLKEKSNGIKAELESRNKEKRELINIMIK